MIPFHEILIFTVAALLLSISPGPNMIYLISRSLTQGTKAGLISLVGVACGFLFHILLVTFGLSAVLLTVPYAYLILKSTGVVYLLYLAFQAIKPNGQQLFEVQTNLKIDNPVKLFRIGFLTNILNPKTAFFYLSFFPQFIKPEYGSVMIQSFELGIIQIIVSFCVSFIIILSAASASRFFANKPAFIKRQKWFMASVLTGLAIKMAFSKVK